MLVIFKSLHAPMDSVTDSTRLSRDDKFRDCVMSESFLPIPAVSLKVCRVSHTSFSKIQFEIGYRELFEQFKIQVSRPTAVLQTVANRCMPSRDHFCLIRLYV